MTGYIFLSILNNEIFEKTDGSTFGIKLWKKSVNQYLYKLLMFKDTAVSLTKLLQYGIHDLYRPGFYAPDISGSSRTVHKFIQVVTYRNLAK